MNRRLTVCLVLCMGVVVPLSWWTFKPFKRPYSLGEYTYGRDPSAPVPGFCSASQLEGITLPRYSDGTLYNSRNMPIEGFPFHTNGYIASRTSINDVITETQNLQYQLFNKLIGEYEYVVLVDLANHENKGDSSIGVGEVLLLQRLKKKMLYYCESARCTNGELTRAREKALQCGKENVAVLCHGGGNIVSYPWHDDIRYGVFSVFQDFKIVIFPQSIWLHNYEMLKNGKEGYARYPNVTMLIRDEQSLQRAQEHFPRNNLILCPDIAFQIGSVPRSLRPHYDVIWIKRTDGESSKYSIFNLQTHGMTVKIADWLKFMPSYGFENTLEKINIASEMGFTFLQRGRVAITDRLHGHILSTMLHMPHVLLDTSDHKLAAYHNTWTKGLEGRTVLVARTPQEALDKAWELIEKFQDQLPTVASYMDLKDGVV